MIFEGALAVGRDHLRELGARAFEAADPVVLTGSHIDTVPEGGSLDGALGVLAGLECLQTIREAGLTRRRPLAVVAWSDEEGRYGSLFGSRAFTGKLDAAQIPTLRAVDGESLVEAMARAARELAGELHAPVKLGHGDQRQLREAGIEPPAAGWLDNLRVDGERLLADLQAVPRKVADLIRSRAYRSRSLELSRVTSQRTGKRYSLVPSGLALLGATTPAVRGLADVAALYEGLDVEPVRAFEAALDWPATSPPGDSARLLDAAIAEGRIALARRDLYVRALEQAPKDTAEFLATLPPDPVRAAVNRRAADPERDKAEREWIAREFGLRVEEVI